MAVNRQILVVEDDPDLRDAIFDTLKLSQFDVHTAEDGDEALQILNHEEISLIISDVQMPGMDGHQLLNAVKRIKKDIPFVLITAYGSIPKAVEAIQCGAADYILKPFEAQVLIEMVNRLLPQQQASAEMIAEDQLSIELSKLAKKVAATEASVMISGESGCGKEVYSQYIHKCSSRSNKPFVAINCAAIPESMLESILFGYEKGAFTGAYTARAGKFEQANGGTLLLDEISEMDINLQAKILRVIQEKEVERLGSNKTTALDVRIIATTNRNLREEVISGRFREDLFYRLNVFPLNLAPLRERPDDIYPLAQKFIEQFDGGKGISLDADAIKILRNHSWGGNVRELENVIQRALILKIGQKIKAEDIIFESLGKPSTSSMPMMDTQTRTVDKADLLETDLKTREKEIIIDALATNSSKKEAAEKLGISPRTLRYKLAQFRKAGIQIPCIPNAARVS